MVSLGISGKQKIATAQVVRQFARWMSIFLFIYFLIMNINNIVLSAIRFRRIGFYHLCYCGGAVKSLSFVAAAGHIGLFAKKQIDSETLPLW